MEVAIAVIGIIITILLWLFQPEPLRRLLRFDSRKNVSGSIKFLIRVGDQAEYYWSEVATPVKLELIPPFQQNCSHFFQLTGFVDDVDPSFDITLISELDSVVVLYELGVDILSVANEWKLYGSPQATKISQQASYTIEIPNIRTEITRELGQFPRLLEPRNIDIALSVRMPDPFRLEPESTFRCELLLKNYVAHMPNCSILRFWVMTPAKRYISEFIHIFTF